MSGIAPFELSRLGVGTYLGRANETDDEGYVETMIEAVQRGVNVLDTAINYRDQMSERAIARVLLALKTRGIPRDRVFLSTKGGYIPGDARAKASMQALMREGLIRRGVMKEDEIVGDVHCISPGYVKHQVDLSLRNMAIPRIDLYYVHNPEEQAGATDRETFLARMRAAFEVLEGCAAAGKIGAYGIATWDGLRTTADDPRHLDLAAIAGLARDVAGDAHHFRALQAPFNAKMPELRDGTGQGGRSALAVAQELGLAVFTSATILQGKLAAPVPELAGRPGTPAQSAIRWVLETPGITTALVGMKTKAHLEENLGAL